LGEVARRSFRDYAPDFTVLARAVGLRGAHTLPERLDDIASLGGRLARDAEAVRSVNEPAWLAYTIFERVGAKLDREAVEDFRIDFEDGYGNRPDAEEDGHAIAAAEEVAKGIAAGTLPPFIGIRTKPFNDELHARSIRTLDLFLTTLAQRAGGKVPDNFFVTLPKVTVREQVTVLADLLDLIEQKTGMAPGAVKVELMIETPQSILDISGESALLALVEAARGRCTGAHFGTYDYTAGCSITAAYQHMRHPVCDFAKHMMQVALAGTGVMLSDGATNVMPIGPHRAQAGGAPLTSDQEFENRLIVHRAWKLHYDDIRHSLETGYYQGWDLHPAQLPTRYAAVYAFFLEGLEAASVRLRNFIDKAAQATLVGDVFDDAATGQGLLNFFLRGIACGAISEQEAQVTGLTLEEIRGRSFVKILNARRTKA
ncbi:MAG: phosphoenolpyruvate kinase, partial [Candidatus Sericytochromatia bacterium]|nr:phosphoenolpyruvate kinase [Candidatus Tanganyikabacteria bacterium]